MGAKDVYNHRKKRGWILKTPLAIFKMQMNRRKVIFLNTSQTLSPVILFPMTLLAANILSWKKVPGI